MRRSPETFRYQALCPTTGERLSLPRTEAVERILLELAPSFPTSEKMYGVLLVEDETGELAFLKAFSGALDGEMKVPGWAPPIRQPGPDPMAPEEAKALEAIAQLGIEISMIEGALEAHPYPVVASDWAAAFERLKALHRSRRQRRQGERDSGVRSAAELALESGHDSGERARFLKARGAALEALRAEYEELTGQLKEFKRERRLRSRELQKVFHEQLFEELGSLLSFPLEQLFSGGPPTGTGDCCAPKLLAAAARWQLRPLALAEVWWGRNPPAEHLAPGAVPGAFCGPCAQRCRPIFGALLRKAQLGPTEIVHRDSRVVAVAKPGGLLSLPGRASWNGDSVFSRLLRQEGKLWPVHRLDLETSGLLLFARDAATAAHLGQQFAQGLVRKTYLARLERPLHGQRTSGVVRAPIARLEALPPRYGIDRSGRDAVTEYRVLDSTRTLVEFRPLTGRSHQLRVHAAKALLCPILGDRIYGGSPGEGPLCLQAQGLEVQTAVGAPALRLSLPPAAWAHTTRGASEA